MCNPRRILVQASRMVCRDWTRQIRRVREGREELSVTDRLVATLRLDESVGDAARDALVALVTGGFRGWRASPDGTATLRLGAVELRYDPVEGVLSVETSLGEVVRAAGEAIREVSGTYVGRLEVNREVQLSEATGIEAVDRVTAERRALEGEFADRIGAIVWARQRDMEAELDEEAREMLAARLEALTAEARERLRAEAARALEAAEPEVRRELGLLLAETYKNALLAMADEYGGEVLSRRENAGMVELEIQI